MKIQLPDGRIIEGTDEQIQNFLVEYDQATSQQQSIEEQPAGPTTADYVRNVAQNLPVIGTYSDELEAALRSSLGQGAYSELRPQYEESAQRASETGLGKGLGIGANVLGNVGIGILTGGANLLPPVSAVQGAIEGFGSGESLENRLARAGTGAAIGAAVPSVLNRIIPTASVQKLLTKSLAGKTLNTASKMKNAPQVIIAKATQQGVTPTEVIAQEVEKGYRPNLWSNLKRTFAGEDVLRGRLYNDAAKVVSKPYSEYVAQEINKVAPKYGSKIGSEMQRLGVNELGEDLVGTIDARKLAMKAVNNIAKKATPKTQNTITGAFEEAIAKRGVAKDMVSEAVANPVSTKSGSIWSFLLRATAPVRNVWNLGTLRMLNPNAAFRSPTSVRSALDAIIEKQQMGTIK